MRVSCRIEDALKADSIKQLNERIRAYGSTKSLPVLDEALPHERTPMIALSRKRHNHDHKTKAGSHEISQQLMKNRPIKNIIRLGPKGIGT